jgi:hypothetical protein
VNRHPCEARSAADGPPLGRRAPWGEARAACIGGILLVAGCASAPPDPDAARAIEGLEIAPYRAHETCFKLADGDRLDWRFESRAPVDFNLHYHEGATVIMPVTLIASTGSAGIYRAIVPQDYCAMWEAGNAGAIVTYRIKPIRVAQ